ncbi:MAG: hypothetical protein WC236_01390 [Gallionellaceae bacterium]
MHWHRYRWRPNGRKYPDNKSTLAPHAAPALCTDLALHQFEQNVPARLQFSLLPGSGGRRIRGISMRDKQAVNFKIFKTPELGRRVRPPW